LFIFLWTSSAVSQNIAEISKEFVKPDSENQPWVYWFWNNGNLTKEGITGDLEAMQRVGIKGVLIMEVGQNAPKGPVDFLSDRWRELFQFMITEAERCSIEVNMNNDPGWNGSGGAWIKPDEAMQVLTWSETSVTGTGKTQEVALPSPSVKMDYYRDIVVLAFPTPDDVTGKAPVNVNANRRGNAENKAVISKNTIIDITKQMENTGTLKWNAPKGNWTVLRIGHTCKGVMVAPAPEAGIGLECDKLSIKGTDAAFAGQIGRLVAENKKQVGKVFVSTHIDSWENGSQNWTANMREEYQQRRHYDLLPYLPVFAGYIVDNTELTDRFLWDFRHTVSEMVLEYHVKRMSDLSHEHGLRLSIEGYDQSPCDFLQFGGIADEPMGEFWCGGSWIGNDGFRLSECKGMSSAGHIYGRNIIGAEAFTAADAERWLRHPGSMKALGDRAFCEGINRFVFHRYSFQPWNNIKPGLMMGPWGVHYERTQTWWELTPAWHEYLTRCQYLLRQGLFVADICYLEPEDSPQGFSNHPHEGYPWDQCGAHAALQMSVKDGRLVLPSGMTYRILVLPQSERMTPELAGKVLQLVKDGATVIGNRPDAALGLVDYPNHDNKLKELATQLWGDASGQSGERTVGKGRIIWGKTAADVLTQQGVTADFTAKQPLNHIHRRTPDADIYFVANPEDDFTLVQTTFRAEGIPELWSPETGKVTPVAAYQTQNGVTNILLPLRSMESVFVVFRKDAANKTDVIASISHDNIPLGIPQDANIPAIKILHAKYGPLKDAEKTIDVKTKVQELINEGKYNFSVTEMAKPVDPAFGVVKTLIIEYEMEDETHTWQGDDRTAVNFRKMEKTPIIAEPSINAAGKICINAWASGHYDVLLVSGKKWSANITIPEAFEITGAWQVQFPKKTLTFNKLISWSNSDDESIRYFSGTAVYSKTFKAPKKFFAADQRIYLDLGEVGTIAELTVNGKSFGTLWKLDKTIDITDALKPSGENQIEIRITNLWPNRLIGDAKLPAEKERQPNGTLSAWPEWVYGGKPDPSGRETFSMWNLWSQDDELQPSGLMGPVKLVLVKQYVVK
jgi:hypothetical protein